MQPVSVAGPEHSKPLEKAESLFNQERDPRFGEIYGSINAGRECWDTLHVHLTGVWVFSASTWVGSEGGRSVLVILCAQRAVLCPRAEWVLQPQRTSVQS